MHFRGQYTLYLHTVFNTPLIIDLYRKSTANWNLEL